MVVLVCEPLLLCAVTTIGEWCRPILVDVRSSIGRYRIPLLLHGLLSLETVATVSFGLIAYLHEGDVGLCPQANPCLSPRDHYKRDGRRG